MNHHPFSLFLQERKARMLMKVYKFGGASIKNAESVRNMAQIISDYGTGELIVVVSAMDKTTNRLERLTTAWVKRDAPTKATLFAEIKGFHFGILGELLPEHRASSTALSDLFNGLWETISGPVPETFDRAYEMVVPYGEMFSSLIIWQHLNHQQFNLDWLDARKLIITDETWREAKINWDQTVANLQRCIQTRRQSGSQLAITQGFIGSTLQGQTTTLGREGSDFTAAIIAFALDAKEVVIWKDVPGLMNADPAKFPDAMMLENISFHEAIELAYYGAKVIHPKTIKPLQNKNIPLRIKSFKDPGAPGSYIHALDKYDQEIPSYIIKDHQTLISCSPRDFSFIAEKNISEIFFMLSSLNLRANLMQNSAISFSVCLDDQEEKVQNLISMLQEHFNVRYNKNLTLITIRHFTDEIIGRFHANAKIILEQRSRNTVQLVVKG
jgi:aspartate kinase